MAALNIGSLRMAAACLLLLMTAACVERAEEIGREVPDEPVVAVQPTMSVSELTTNPKEHNGEEVVLSGTVSAGLAFEFVDEQPYLLDDGTGLVWVITHDIVPAEGSVVTVTGRVQAPYQIKGRRYEVAVLETGRQ